MIAYSPVAPTDSMVWYYKFDICDISATTLSKFANYAPYNKDYIVAYDASGVNNTFYSIAVSNNRCGYGCLYINARSGAINGPGFIISTTELGWTHCFWYKTVGTVTDNDRLVDLSTTSGGVYQIMTNGTKAISINMSTIDGVINLLFTPPSGVNPWDGNWHHFEFVVSALSGNWTLYIDNIAYSQATLWGGTWGSTTSPGAALQLGTWNGTIFGNKDANSSAFSGYIDDIRVYTRELYGNEITSIYMIYYKPPVLTGTYTTSGVTNPAYISMVTFTGSGTIQFDSDRTIQILLVAGGGYGGYSNTSLSVGGGGGGGGVAAGSIFCSAGTIYTISIGAGGVYAMNGYGNGGDTTFTGSDINLSVYGGGGGGIGAGSLTSLSTGNIGGCGGGSGGQNNLDKYMILYGKSKSGTNTGTTKGNIVFFGNNGAPAAGGLTYGTGGGGGGGAGAPGNVSPSGTLNSGNGGQGGNGYTWPLNSLTYGGGGGGGQDMGGGINFGGTGGGGTGGRAGRTGGSPGTFYGGGGGGTSYISNITVVNADGNNPGAEGYQGIVIIAYN